jgi:hypothetical protein
MRITNVADRSDALTRDGASDMEKLSDGRFGPYVQEVYLRGEGRRGRRAGVGRPCRRRGRCSRSA